ncbi:hypothetical protein NDN13_05025 [Acinetobacter sp. C32I]|uniref:hypothetical protein n=1 Tax=Acinetobacter sp. C32I TaxID=2950074 RepID=UPI0020373623|nr:hypothetical protein [Acinetobacter sp. C32I]USA54559.1 hypothetical protein NDN13_05025 [Acinetobacter sp. C32I]
MSKPVSFLIDDLLNRIKNHGEYISAIELIQLIATYQKRKIQYVASYLYKHNLDEIAPMYERKLVKRNEFESEVHFSIADNKYNQKSWHQTSNFLHRVKFGEDDIFAKTEIEEVIHGFGEKIFTKSQENFLTRWKDYCWLTDDLINFQPINKLNNRELRGLKPDWSYWLSLYELDVSCLINLSMGLNPLGDNKHYSSLLDEIVIHEGGKELDHRMDVLFSYIGNDNHPFIFKDEDKLSKIHTKIKIKDFVAWAKSLGWNLPEELQDLFESYNSVGLPVIGHATTEHYQQQRDQLLLENEKLKAELLRAQEHIKQLEQQGSSEHPSLDRDHPNHAPELLLAIQAWESKYIHNEYPHHDHTPAIKAFLNKSGYTGTRLQDRIAAITNPKDINKSKN